MNVISTKDKIKSEAFKIFAAKGYEGSSMKEIADAVGINKASLYAHYSGKEELFLAVYEDFAQAYEKVHADLLDAAKDMSIENQLRYIFEEYIFHYYRNPIILAFWFQGLLLAPPDLIKKILPDLFKRESAYIQRLKAIFAEGIKVGIIRQSNPEKLVWSYRSMMEGLLSRLMLKSIKEEWIKEFWDDFWLGLKERK